MLKRARLWMESGLVAALFGFTGLLQTTAVLFQLACYTCALFFVLSLLFSLFEPSDSPTGRLSLSEPSMPAAGRHGSLGLLRQTVRLAELWPSQAIQADKGEADQRHDKTARHVVAVGHVSH